jgi:hypothetical protein
MSSAKLPKRQDSGKHHSCKDCWTGAMNEAARKMGQAQISESVKEREQAYPLKCAVNWFRRMRDEGESFPGHGAHN